MKSWTYRQPLALESAATTSVPRCIPRHRGNDNQIADLNMTLRDETLHRTFLSNQHPTLANKRAIDDSSIPPLHQDSNPPKSTMHISLNTAMTLLSFALTTTALPFHLFGSTTAMDPTDHQVGRDTITIPSISALNYRIPEQRNYGLFDRPSPAIYPDLQVGQ
jgi:hypothetical protein